MSRSTDLTRKVLVLFVILSLLGSSFPTLALAGDPEEGAQDPSSAAIIQKYLDATRGHDSLRGASMQVDINASVPKLKENGKLRALRKISKVGQITYRILSFQGDNTVKNQVIARYLDAEQQGQGDHDMAITPDNYRFKFRGDKPGPRGERAYVFQLSPVKKRVGLFKGELWLDAETYLPVFEKGRLVKNPSIWFKQVDFERGFAIQDGLSVPSYITSTINTRLVGKVELQVNFSKVVQDTAEVAGEPNAFVLASAGARWAE
jgi:hypothetical protein